MQAWFVFQSQPRLQILCVACQACLVIVNMKGLSLKENSLLELHADCQLREGPALPWTDPNLPARLAAIFSLYKT